MSDATAEPTETPAEGPTEDTEPALVLTEPVEVDVLLRSLCHSAWEDDEFGLGLTLTVNGILVTGKLVSRKRWLAEMQDAYPTLSGLVEGWAAAFARQEAELDEDSPVPHFSYAHLTKARHFVGDRSVPTNGQGFWRGRLAHVSGFSLGELGAAAESDD